MTRTELGAATRHTVNTAVNVLRSVTPKPSTDPATSLAGGQAAAALLPSPSGPPHGEPVPAVAAGTGRQR